MFPSPPLPPPLFVLLLLAPLTTTATQAEARVVFNWVLYKQTKVITLANHNRRKQHKEPIKLEANTCNWRQARKWLKFGIWLVKRVARVFPNQSESVVKQSKHVLRITFDTQLKSDEINTNDSDTVTNKLIGSLTRTQPRSQTLSPFLPLSLKRRESLGSRFTRTAQEKRDRDRNIWVVQKCCVTTK